MDPTKCLEEIRELVKRLTDEEDVEEVELAALGQELAEFVDGLDGWMMKGGFLPQQWGEARASLPPPT